MSESTEAKAESPEQPAAPAGKGGKLAIILAAVNFIAVLGLGGYLFYTQQHAAAQGKKSGDKDAHGAKEGEGGEHGAPAEGEHGAAAEGEHGEAAEGEHGGGGEHGAAKEEGGHGEKKSGGHGAEPQTASVHSDELSGHGPLMALEPLVTNLAAPDTDRYLKVTMQLRISSEAAKAEVEANLVPVRNQVLLYLSSLTIEDTVGADNKREIQKRVKRIANEAMPSSRISQVYFTEFVIQ